MSFINSIEGNVPNSVLKYSTTQVQTDDLIAVDATITNATITNLTTTTYTAVNASFGTITATNATINNADITTEIVQTSYITLLNALTAVITDATITNISAGDIDLNNIIIKEQSSSLTDKSIIYRDANQILFVGREDVNTSNGVDYLFYTGLKAGVPTFKIYKTNLCEATNMTILNVLTSKYSNTELLELIDTTLANRKSYIELVNGEFKFIAGTSANTNILFYNKLTDGPMLTINSTGIETPEIEVTTIDSGTIDTDLALFSDSSNNNDKSRIYREGNVLKIAQGAVAGDADASIHFFIGPPTGTPPLKIDKNNNKTTTIDLASDDLFSLRGTINTFNSTSITSPAISGDEIETQNILWNDKITSNDSYFDRENNIFRFNGSSGATPVDWEFYKTSGINPIVKIEAANDTMTVAGSIVGDISQNLSAGTGIGLSTTAGITTISNIAPIPPTLNINTLNSTTINNSGTITTNILNGDISGNLTAGTNITLSTTAGNTTINSTIADPLTINTLNSTTINNTGTITSNVLNGDISGNLTAGTGITLSTTGGNTTINSSTPDPLTINTLNSTTINNNGDINNTNGNINLDVNTGKVYANEFNGSIGRIRSIVSAQNGSYFLTNSTNTGSFAIFSSATGEFYMNTSPSNLNFGSTSASTGPVAMTIDGTTKDIEIFTNLTTVDITNSGTITSNILNGDISNNLTGGYGITLYTVGGNTTISATTGLYMCVTRTGNYAPGGGSTGYTLLYNNITATNGIAYNATNGQATIPFTGLYSISASVNIDNVSVNARINIRIRIRINGSWFQGYPQAYGYIRNQNEVTYATATCSDWIVQLTQNDIIDVVAHVGVGTNTSFSSSFLGLQFFNGATFTIRRVDV